MVAISIIIPVYNIEKYLNQCLDSILAQTFEDYEIICVNDGSKDDSLKILQEYALKYSKIKVISQENGGSGSARNNGLSKAQGKYVQFLDGDDYFEPKMLETLYNLAEKHQADMAVCSSKKVDDEGNILELNNPNSPLNLPKLVFDKPYRYKDYPDDIFNLTGTIPWNKLYLREMLNKNGLSFPKLTGPDDFCFVQMANVCAEKIVVCPDKLINYRYNRPGSVQTYRANHTIDIVKAGLYIKDFLEERGLYTFLKKAYLQMMFGAIRWETSLCDDKQYKDFVQKLKEIMPDNWEIFSPALRKDYLTVEYLKKFIRNKKVYLWGASNFIRDLLAKEEEKNPNILGIIDKNEALWGSDFCGYKVFSPNVLEEKPSNILITIYRNYETVYDLIKAEVGEKYQNVCVLPNIFMGEVEWTEQKNNF